MMPRIHARGNAHESHHDRRRVRDEPEHRNQFIELIKAHAQRSRAEDGCQQFDVLLPQDDHNRVLLV
jgi:quinol monooxygenase YgiN